MLLLVPWMLAGPLRLLELSLDVHQPVSEPWRLLVPSQRPTCGNVSLEPLDAMEEMLHLTLRLSALLDLLRVPLLVVLLVIFLAEKKVPLPESDLGLLLVLLGLLALVVFRH